MHPFFKKIVSHIPAPLAHDLAPYLLSIYANSFAAKSAAATDSPATTSTNQIPQPPSTTTSSTSTATKSNAEKFQWRAFTWKPKNKKPLHFRNPLGIAGGVDKTGEQVLNWQKLGAGFLEVGTVTPYPQGPNPGKILDRNWEQKNLWNRMGFPGPGMQDVFITLMYAKSKLKIPLFINVGKNRSTSNTEAVNDYIDVIQKFSSLADAFVINISSPNTKNLRELQNDQFIQNICHHIKQIAPQTPILVKLSPDLSRDELELFLNAGLTAGIDGFILTNTTLQRPAHVHFPSEGGLSGQDLKPIAIQKLKEAIQILGNRRSEVLLISVGGVLHPEDAIERLEIGADLVQTYSGLVFTGPDFFIQTMQRT